MAGRPNELDSSKSLHTIEASLLHALLSAAAGGYLDAFTFVGKGGVFANAMTGNVVIMGSLMAAAKWTQAWFRIPPIAAFIAGVWCAKIFDLAPLRRIVRWPLMTSLAIEVALLLVGGTVPNGVADAWLVLGISFVAALQNSTFSRIEGLHVSTVITTGNLKNLSETSVTLAFGPRDPEAARRARFYGGICLCFLLGAALGARFTTMIGNYALWPAAVLLSVVCAHLWWQLRQRLSASRVDRSIS